MLVNVAHGLAGTCGVLLRHPVERVHWEGSEPNQKGPQVPASAAWPCATGLETSYLLVGLLPLSDTAGIGDELGSFELAPAMCVPALFQVVD